MSTNRNWYGKQYQQGLVIDEYTGDTIAVVYDPKNTPILTASPALLLSAKCALADLEGIMPVYEPSGERTHPAWQTITELRAAIQAAEPE